ncbi:MAG: DUF4421 domain-containing protein, partial [Bacteroidota bacterium]|nr:DUF4421 domain-containing protein [Bacteroidota bacterium]
FFRHWFVNIYTLPGLSVQQFISTNAYNEQTHTNYALGAAFHSRLSIGYNRRSYFIGIALAGNQYAVDNDKKSSLNFNFGYVKFYYGHRFDLRKLLKKKL